MNALLSPHEAMINLAVSSKVTFSFRSILSYPPHTPFPQHPLLSRFYLSKSGASPSSRVAVGKKAQSKNQRKHYDFSLLPSSLSNIISRHLWISKSFFINPPFSVSLLATRSPPRQLLQLKGNAVVLPDKFVTL